MVVACGVGFMMIPFGIAIIVRASAAIGRERRLVRELAASRSAALE
jgi:hypothetical protein